MKKFTNKELWLFNIASPILFILLSFLLPFLGNGVLVLFIIIHFVKVMLFDKSLFNGQGIYSFSLLMLYSFMLFVLGGVSERFSFGGWGLLAIWMGFFHLRKIVKPFNMVMRQKEDPVAEFTFAESESNLFTSGYQSKKPSESDSDLFSTGYQEQKTENVEDLFDQLP